MEKKYGGAIVLPHPPRGSIGPTQEIVHIKKLPFHTLVQGRRNVKNLNGDQLTLWA